MRIIELDNPLKILNAKQEIEKKLIEEGKIEKEMELQDFVKFLNLQETIYCKNDTVIPFRIYDDMLFFVGQNDTKNELITALESIDYKFSNTRTVPTVDVYNGELDKYEYFFIVQSKYMVKD